MRIRRRVRRLRSAAVDAGLGAPDLAFEVVALASLGILKLFFPCLELLVQGLLAGHQLLKFFLWLHSCRW